MKAFKAAGISLEESAAAPLKQSESNEYGAVLQQWRRPMIEFGCRSIRWYESWQYLYQVPFGESFFQVPLEIQLDPHILAEQ